MAVNDQLHAPASLTLWGQVPVPTSLEAQWAQSQPGCCGEESNISVLLGFEPRFVQPVA